MPNVGVSVLGGTGVSIYKDRKRQPSKEGYRIVLEKALFPLREEGFNTPIIGKPIFLDSVALSTTIRNRPYHQGTRYLRKGNDGMAIIHGTGTLQTTAMMGYWGLKKQTDIYILTGSRETADKEGSEIIQNVQNSIRIAGLQDAPSIVGIFFYGYLLSPFSRVHNFHTHDVHFRPSDIREPLGVMKDGKFIRLPQGVHRRYLDSPFYIPTGLKGHVRMPLIQRLRDYETIYDEILPMENFLVQFALLMNFINNSDEEYREKSLYPEFWKLTESYHVDGERLFSSMTEKNEPFYEGWYDLNSVATIAWRDIPRSRVGQAKRREFKGAIIECSGDGELNLTGGKRSHVPLLEAMNENDIPFVITPISDVPYSFRYQPEMIDKKGYGGIGGGFKRPDEAKVKLSKFFHPKSMKILKDVSSYYGVPVNPLIHIMYEGGSAYMPGERYRPEERWEYVERTGVPTLVDLMDTNFSFKVGANLAGEYASKQLEYEKTRRKIEVPIISTVKEYILKAIHG